MSDVKESAASRVEEIPYRCPYCGEIHTLYADPDFARRTKPGGIRTRDLEARAKEEG